MHVCIHVHRVCACVHACVYNGASLQGQPRMVSVKVGLDVVVILIIIVLMYLRLHIRYFKSCHLSQVVFNTGSTAMHYQYCHTLNY